ncbi:MAG: glycosyltransferase family 4 protein [Balneola sp.]
MTPTNKKLLIIGTVWPEPRSSAAGSRMMELIEFFQHDGFEITFACSASNLEFSEDLGSLGVKTKKIKINDSAFDTFIQELNPTIVLFDRFMTEEQFGWRIIEQCPDAIRILDTEDLHSLRYGRHKAFKEGREFSNDDLYSNEARREIASIYRCDLSLIISRYEMELLTNFFKVDSSILHYLPFMKELVSESEQHVLPRFSDRAHFVSIGNFLHEPNWDAVRFLKEEIWRLIRKELPQAELHIFGAYTSPKVTQLHNAKEGFLIKGRAEDVREVVQNSRVLLAPLRFGAGLKGKLVDAMRYGTPSVTTDIGAEGLFTENGWGGSIENAPKQIADRSIYLYTNKEHWEEAQEKGFQNFNSLFDKEMHSKAFKRRVKQLSEEIVQHRNKNFMGSVLNQSTIQSYKYMSKWIEEKNKNS